MYKHQWNTKWTFTQNFISSHVKVTFNLHCCYGYIINHAFFTGVYIILNRILHTRLWMCNLSSHVELDLWLIRSTHSCFLSWTLEEKIHIYMRALNILYISYHFTVDLLYQIPVKYMYVFIHVCIYVCMYSWHHINTVYNSFCHFSIYMSWALYTRTTFFYSRNSLPICATWFIMPWDVCSKSHTSLDQLGKWGIKHSVFRNIILLLWNFLKFTTKDIHKVYTVSTLNKNIFFLPLSLR